MGQAVIGSLLVPVEAEVERLIDSYRLGCREKDGFRDMLCTEALCVNMPTSNYFYPFCGVWVF